MEEKSAREIQRSFGPVEQLDVIVPGTTGAPGDPVQGHVVGAIRHVQEPKTDHLLADKNAQDHQLPPHPATQMIAQVRHKIRF